MFSTTFSKSILIALLDFADFATAAAPSPVSLTSTLSGPPAQRTFGPNVPMSDRPFTKWYNIHERVTIADFYTELFVLPFVIILTLVHLWGSNANRQKAKAWMQQHVSALKSEFAVVGFGGRKSAGSITSEQVDDSIVKEKAKDVFLSYATGRQNVAFADIKLNLYKRYNPLAIILDFGLGFFFESMPAPSEKAEITIYPFDGKEGQLVPRVPGQESEKKGRDSTYDGFVWAIVHKDVMKRLRDERYDLSLTSTKENAKLPAWATVMSESAEITDTLLTAELAKAVEACGEDLEALVVSDMPEDAPKT